METMEMGESVMAFFPWTPSSGKATGAVVQSTQHKPSMEGSIIYLNANPNMDNVMTRIEVAGGKVLMPKMNIGEHGNIAFILDTEGNKIGIHSVE
jgi:predicted enzyme related to lactoylglutathione lyase